MPQPIKSQVVSVEKSGTENLYNVECSNGQTYLMYVNPKKSQFPEEGKDICFFKDLERDGQYTFWKFDDSPPQGEGGQAKKGGRKGTSEWKKKDDYWKGKDLYEREIRDPKIELQTYTRLFTEAGIAAVNKGLPLHFTDKGRKKAAEAECASDIIEWAFSAAKGLVAELNKAENEEA